MKHAHARLLPACLALCALFAASAWASSGSDIVVDGQGRINFSDFIRNCIWRVDAPGELTVLATGRHTHTLFLDQSGNLYGEHVPNNAAGEQEANL